MLDPQRRCPPIDQGGDLPRLAQIEPENLDIRFDRRDAFGGDSEVTVARAADGSDDVMTEQGPMAREVMSHETRNASNHDLGHVNPAP